MVFVLLRVHQEDVQVDVFTTEELERVNPGLATFACIMAFATFVPSVLIAVALSPSTTTSTWCTVCATNFPGEDAQCKSFSATSVALATPAGLRIFNLALSAVVICWLPVIACFPMGTFQVWFVCRNRFKNRCDECPRWMVLLWATVITPLSPIFAFLLSILAYTQWTQQQGELCDAFCDVCTATDVSSPASSSSKNCGPCLLLAAVIFLGMVAFSCVFRALHFLLYKSNR